MENEATNEIANNFLYNGIDVDYVTQTAYGDPIQTPPRVNDVKPYYKHFWFSIILPIVLVVVGMCVVIKRKMNKIAKRIIVFIMLVILIVLIIYGAMWFDFMKSYVF